MTPDHSSPPVPSPLNICCRYGAAFTGSPVNVALPLASVPCVPHWLPQNTRKTFGEPLVTPMPSMPPPNASVFNWPAPGLAYQFAYSFMCCQASRVGTTPWRYSWPWAGEYGLSLPMPSANAKALARHPASAAASSAVRRQWDCGWSSVLQVLLCVRLLGSPCYPCKRKKDGCANIRPVASFTARRCRLLAEGGATPMGGAGCAVLNQ